MATFFQTGFAEPPALAKLTWKQLHYQNSLHIFRFMPNQPPLGPFVLVPRILLRPDAENDGNNNDYEDQAWDNNDQHEF